MTYDLRCVQQSRLNGLLKECPTCGIGPCQRNMMDAKTADTRRMDEPWHLISDKVDLKILGKLQEELGELQSAIARCIIQGVDGVHPVTGKSNRLWLAEEVADVYASMSIAVERFLAESRKIIHDRKHDKLTYLKRWHEQA